MTIRTTIRMTILLAAVLALASACGEDNNNTPSTTQDGSVANADGTPPPTPDTGSSDSTADSGPPPLTSKYTVAVLRFASAHKAGLSCSSLCAVEKGKCADASSEVQGEYATCYGKAPYYIPRAWYEIGNSSTSDQLECNDIVPPTKKGGLFGTTVHEFVQFDCCCLLRETQWLANDIKSPKSCSEVCKARGLECGSHDRCRDIPSLCSKSFPEFFVQSMATYGEDPKTGKGMLTFPTCDEVPATNRLESHRCVCL